MKKRYIFILTLVVTGILNLLIVFCPITTETEDERDEAKYTFVYPMYSDSFFIDAAKPEQKSEMLLTVGFSKKKTSNVKYFSEKDEKISTVSKDNKNKTKTTVMTLPKSKKPYYQLGLSCQLGDHGGVKFNALSEWKRLDEDNEYHLSINFANKTPKDFTSKGYVYNGNMYIKTVEKDD